MDANVELQDRSSGRPTRFDWGTASVALLLVWIGVISFRPVINNDVFLHMRMGQDILASGEVPHVDAYSAVAEGRTFIAKEWLSGVVFALCDRVGPLALTLLRPALTIPAILLLFLTLPRSLRRSSMAVPFLILCAYVLGFRFIVRPHLFSLLFVCLLLYLLARWWRSPGGRLHWFLPVLFALWVNLHGGFFFGLVLVGVVLTSAALARVVPGLARDGDPQWSRIRSLLVVLVVSALATLVNPYGLDLVKLPLGMSAQDSFLRERISEWGSPFGDSFRDSREIIFYGWVAILASLWVGIAATLPRRSMIEIGLALCVTVMSLRANRFIAYAAIASFPILVSSWSDLARMLLDGEWRRRPLLEILAVCLLIFTAVSHGYAYGSKRRPLGHGYGGPHPYEMTAAIKRAGLEGVIFTDLMMDGSLVIRDLVPDIKPVMDARMDVYGEQLYMEWKGCHESEEQFFEYLEKYEVNLALISVNSDYMAIALSEHPDWGFVFSGDSRSLFMRNPLREPN